jgi:hypothetical protein
MANWPKPAAGVVDAGPVGRCWYTGFKSDRAFVAAC